MKDLSFSYIVGTTSLAFVVSQLDVSIVNIALPSISKAFSANISSLQWIADAYTIAFAALMLSAGGMSDKLGSKRVFQLGLLLFGIASTGCSLAWNAIANGGALAVVDAVKISGIISSVSLGIVTVLLYRYIGRRASTH